MVAEAGDLPQVILEINMCSVRCRSLKMQPCFMQTYIYCIYTCLCTGGAYWIMIICFLKFGVCIPILPVTKGTKFLLPKFHSEQEPCVGQEKLHPKDLSII